MRMILPTTQLAQGHSYGILIFAVKEKMQTAVFPASLNPSNSLSLT